jgi:hypothetical protein
VTVDVFAALESLMAAKSPIIVIAAVRLDNDIRANIRSGINDDRTIIWGPGIGACFGREAEEKTAESERGESGFAKSETDLY